MNSLQLYIAKLFRIAPVPPVPKPYVSPETVKMTLDEWRRQENLVLESRTLARNPTYRAQMEVLRNSHPCHTLFSPIGVNPNDRIVHQAKIEGFELALNNLEAMANPLKHTKPLEATFEAPEETTTKRK